MLKKSYHPNIGWNAIKVHHCTCFWFIMPSIHCIKIIKNQNWIGTVLMNMNKQFYFYNILPEIWVSTTELFKKSAEMHQMHLSKMARIVTQDPQIPLLRASGITRRGMSVAWQSLSIMFCVILPQIFIFLSQIQVCHYIVYCHCECWKKSGNFAEVVKLLTDEE